MNFESDSGEPVRHINVKINEEGNAIYSKPDLAHVHEVRRTFEYNDIFT